MPFCWFLQIAQQHRTDGSETHLGGATHKTETLLTEQTNLGHVSGNMKKEKKISKIEVDGFVRKSIWVYSYQMLRRLESFNNHLVSLLNNCKLF